MIMAFRTSSFKSGLWQVVLICSSLSVCLSLCVRAACGRGACHVCACMPASVCVRLCVSECVCGVCVCVCVTSQCVLAERSVLTILPVSSLCFVMGYVLQSWEIVHKITLSSYYCGSTLTFPFGRQLIHFRRSNKISRHVSFCCLFRFDLRYEWQ